jgi:hypothetical protein
MFSIGRKLEAIEVPAYVGKMQIFDIEAEGFYRFELTTKTPFSSWAAFGSIIVAMAYKPVNIWRCPYEVDPGVRPNHALVTSMTYNFAFTSPPNRFNPVLCHIMPPGSYGSRLLATPVKSHLHKQPLVQTFPVPYPSSALTIKQKQGASLRQQSFLQDNPRIPLLLYALPPRCSVVVEVRQLFAINRARQSLTPLLELKMSSHQPSIERYQDVGGNPSKGD